MILFKARSLDFVFMCCVHLYMGACDERIFSLFVYVCVCGMYMCLYTFIYPFINIYVYMPKILEPSN